MFFQCPPTLHTFSIKIIESIHLLSKALLGGWKGSVEGGCCYEGADPVASISDGRAKILLYSGGGEQMFPSLITFSCNSILKLIARATMIKFYKVLLKHLFYKSFPNLSYSPPDLTCIRTTFLWRKMFVQTPRPSDGSYFLKKGYFSFLAYQVPPFLFLFFFLFLVYPRVCFLYLVM